MPLLPSFSDRTNGAASYKLQKRKQKNPHWFQSGSYNNPNAYLKLSFYSTRNCTNIQKAKNQILKTPKSDKVEKLPSDCRSEVRETSD